MKKVSVIVTTYNSEDYILKTVESILNQKGKGTLFEIQLIVVDDCSTDRTRSLLKEKGIEFLSTPENTGGPNNGRNIGLDKVEGDYICIVDHDDMWHENKIASQLSLVKHAGIVTSGYTIISEDKIFHRVNNPTNEGVGFVKYERNKSFLKKLSKSKKGQNLYLGSILYSASLKHIKFEEHFGFIDFDWVLRLFHNRESVEACESLYDRHVNKTNLSLNREYRRVDFYFSLMTIERYEDQFPMEVKKAYKRIHGSRARYFYLINNMKKARRHFLQSSFNWKTAVYFLSTYFGSKYVKKNFNVFG